MNDVCVGLCKLHPRCIVFHSQQMHVPVYQNHLNLVGVVYCSVLYHHIIQSAAGPEGGMARDRKPRLCRARNRSL